MAQLTTNLGKIHVFPSEALYNQFKDIIADNDLALLKDDGAYIVAALLEQNGYVKFSNGLILQWGNAGNSGGSVNVTFPVSFTKTVYQIQLTYNSESYENPTYEIKDTKSFRYWSKYGGDKLWFAIGMQQWGVNTGNSAGVEYSFPVSFTSKLYTALATPCIKSEFWTNPATIVVKSLTKYKVGAYDLQSGQIWWLAIGV